MEIIPRLNIIHLENDQNFPHRELREQSFLRQIQEQGITDYLVWPGIYDKHYPKQGICRSHKAIVRDAMDNNLPCCLIMEDDCVFSAPGAFDYFISQVPEEFDLFMGLIYVGEVVENRVMNGFSGGVTLYIVHNKFYETFLELPDNVHVDRELGETCFKHQYYVCIPYVVMQFSENYSENMKRVMDYSEYHKTMSFYNK